MGFILSIWCGKRGAEGGKRVFPPARLFWGKTPKKLRAKHSAPKAFWCVFGVVLAQEKSPCSEATTDEAVFLLQFCFNSASDGRSPKSPPPFREWAVFGLQGTLKALCLAFGITTSPPPCKGRKGPSACVFAFDKTYSENACICVHLHAPLRRGDDRYRSLAIAIGRIGSKKPMSVPKNQCRFCGVACGSSGSRKKRFPCKSIEEKTSGFFPTSSSLLFYFLFLAFLGFTWNQNIVFDYLFISSHKPV